MDNQTIKYILGEDKLLEFQAENCNGMIVVQQADYVLSDSDKTVLAKGSCDINGAMISVQICPTKTGYMTLEITYRVAPNTLKARFTVYVDQNTECID